MNFSIGDGVDGDLCVALSHEFFRCDDAFEAFEKVRISLKQDRNNKRLRYKAYNHYADFLHHYYEFMIGCYRRDYANTKDPDHKEKDAYIMHHANRVLRNRREDIRRGIPDALNLNRFEYPETAPSEFASSFRRYRNIVGGHTNYERSEKFRFSDFYKKYHKYVCIMYLESLSWWGRHKLEYPYLKEMSDFAECIID